MNNFAENIRKLRNHFGLTQKDFGKKIFKSMRTIQDWEGEKSKPAEEALNQITMILNVNPSWLRNGEGEMFLNDGKEVSPLLNQLIERMKTLDNDNLSRLAGYIDSLQLIVKSGKKSRGGEF